MKTKLERLQEEIAKIKEMQRKFEHDRNEPVEGVIKGPIFQ